MGVFIYLDVSRSVTKDEWEKVYEETLKLIENFPFGEMRKIEIHNVEVNCFVPTRERERDCRILGRKKTTTGWGTFGDLEHLETGEMFYLFRDLVDDQRVEPDAGDAMLSALPDYMNYDWDDKRFNNCYYLWGMKTQGEPYHIYLLAVAALIEARLGTKAFTRGDVTREQFKEAVEIANTYLDKPIELPCRCNMKCLAERAKDLPLPEIEQLEAFIATYLGAKGADFGEFLRQAFSENLLDEYWKKVFEDAEIKTSRFDRYFRYYILWGFDFRKLPYYVNFQSNENNADYECFVKKVMDAKLHFMFAEEEKKRIERYIPIEEIRQALKTGVGEYCDTDTIIDEYLEEETKRRATDIKDADDPGEAFMRSVEQKRSKLIKMREEFDIIRFDDLRFYKTGDKMPEVLKISLGKSMGFLNSLKEQGMFKVMMKKDIQEKFEFLTERNQYFLLQEKDWEKIYNDIQNNQDSFGRYYSIFMTKMTSRNLIKMGIGLLLNDELYEYGQTIAVYSEEDNTK